MAPARIRARHYHPLGSQSLIYTQGVHQSRAHYNLFSFPVKMLYSFKLIILQNFNEFFS